MYSLPMRAVKDCFVDMQSLVDLGATSTKASQGRRAMRTMSATLSGWPQYTSCISSIMPCLVCAMIERRHFCVGCVFEGVVVDAKEEKEGRSDYSTDRIDIVRVFRNMVKASRMSHVPSVYLLGPVSSCPCGLLPVAADVCGRPRAQCPFSSRCARR